MIYLPSPLVRPVPPVFPILFNNTTIYVATLAENPKVILDCFLSLNLIKQPTLFLKCFSPSLFACQSLDFLHSFKLECTSHFLCKAFPDIMAPPPIMDAFMNCICALVFMVITPH